ncbi:bifunctional phosphoribosyl-AMP cyclohydrolase/phosphoribosyl-ATP diphosphatase HisIE [Algoriphagus sp.]|uniref:bifunctional phosphoribosyl-AMP cyclohydrolase/phosphoribosyl-ATP diphosphatase HisIE n=1 Tax=Algoriphagus sp. TaxID=1872435 RepID=UPI00271DE49F|nr:bifunctional phosphoribosyl-AMP cyclohydrolase/phosphoribosyl-ATP diphosphatase HisIE [Algoriphagus sp.]MDO8967015.1 bifunctional phosphoribosyl-AMP cyclohydrolase/phosphoribosyl-ATP diphosphatase HisIE [Algoriphagus sp.]MDP3199491.1 bifunctional phosphoribosyl-AMP cyclohydrolase/phosphoribosyl-ATP diphosphatase HisIE [Algoriphagus sp.]
MNIDFNKMNHLVPAIVQDALSGKVLMQGFMNEEALAKTQESGMVTFFSRSKNRLWTKGETSGNFMELVSVTVDCDGDSILIKANPRGHVCHTGADTCFFEENSSKTGFIDQLRTIIKDRKNNPNDTSYTASLFAKGINKIAQKVGEEAVEIVIEAKDDNKALFLGEAADLLFHYLVLLEAKNYELDEVMEVLMERHKK